MFAQSLLNLFFMVLIVLAINATPSANRLSVVINDSDLNGLYYQSKIFIDLDTALKIPDYGTDKFQAGEDETNADLVFIGNAFLAVAEIITGEAVETKNDTLVTILMIFQSISQELTTISNDLDAIKSDLMANPLPIYQSYWKMREEILIVQKYYKNLIDKPSKYYLQQFNDKCIEYNLYYTLKSIQSLICGADGQVPDELTADYNRTQYNSFLSLVMGDINNAATLRESCLGVESAFAENKIDNDEMSTERYQIADLINQITESLQNGDSKISKTFMPKAEAIVRQIMNSTKSQLDQAQEVLSTLQSKFDWLQWAQMISPKFNGESYSDLDPANHFWQYGFFELWDKVKYRNWVSFWTIKSPEIVNWQEQVDKMMQQNNNYFCCIHMHDVSSYPWDTARGAKCIIDAINDPDSGIKGVRAYNAYFESLSHSTDYFTRLVASSGCHAVNGCNNNLFGVVCAGPA